MASPSFLLLDLHYEHMFITLGCQAWNFRGGRLTRSLETVSLAIRRAVMDRIAIVREDITRLKVDVMVNAADHTLPYGFRREFPPYGVEKI